MPPPPRRLPDPGTPAFTATADQFAAAQRDATTAAAALLHDGALLVAPTGPLMATLLDPTLRREPCAHIAQARGPQPMFVPEPRLLVCQACRGGLRAPTACAACGRGPAIVLPHRIHVAQRGLAVAYGLLCFSCGNREHPPRGTTA